MKAIILRYVLPTIVTVIVTWFGKSYISNILDKANGYDQAKQELQVEKAKHQAKLEEIQTDLAKAKETAQAADKRREHWRQSYYKVKNEYSEYVKEWGAVSYPDDID